MAGGGGGSEYEVGINLTALLDVLTNLLFFLMFGYAAQQFSVEVEGGVRLPETHAEIAPKKDVKVLIGPNDLRIDTKIIATIKDGQIEAKLDSEGRIQPLYKMLAEIKDRTGSNVDADVLMVLCDKEASYGVLRQVMMTAAGAGYVKFRLGGLMQ